MRRRLSIAAALIGSPKIIILDEPTTGLDPDTRRQLWGIIEKEKAPDRLILLTTHSMEEADTLCSTIAIMVHGKLRVVAGQQYLKSQYGTGFKLELTTHWLLNTRTPKASDMAIVPISGHVGDAAEAADAQDMSQAQVDTFVRSFCPAASVTEVIGATMTYALPKNSFDPAAALSLLQKESRNHGIVAFSLVQPSLEEVFVHIALKYSTETHAAPGKQATTKPPGQPTGAATCNAGMFGGHSAVKVASTLEVEQQP